MGLALVLLLNAILLIRPAEFIPGLMALPLYEIVLALCVLACAPMILAELSPARLAVTPILGCLLAFLAISLLSDISRGDFDRSEAMALDALRIVLYMTLTIGVLDSPARLRLFLAMCVLNATLLTGLAILNYQGMVAIPGFIVTDDEGVRRLGASGLFGDPNDMALLITQGAILSAFCLTNRSTPAVYRLLHLWAIAILGYGLQLTHSRGGLLGLLAGIAVGLLARFRGKGLLLAGVALPAAVAAFAGRQADFGGAIGSGSGQSRIHLWDEYLALALHNPVLGIGAGAWKDHARQVAHNSFLHAFAETGLPGGMVFLALLMLAALTLRSFGPNRTQVLDPGMARLCPFLLAMLAGYSMGMLSLTRVYTIPTYTMLAIVAAYARVTDADPPPPVLHLDLRFWGKASLLGLAFLGLLWIYIKRSASYYG